MCQVCAKIPLLHKGPSTFNITCIKIANKQLCLNSDVKGEENWQNESKCHPSSRKCMNSYKSRLAPLFQSERGIIESLVFFLWKWQWILYLAFAILGFWTLEIAHKEQIWLSTEHRAHLQSSFKRCCSIRRSILRLTSVIKVSFENIYVVAISYPVYHSFYVDQGPTLQIANRLCEIAGIIFQNIIGNMLVP